MRTPRHRKARINDLRTLRRIYRDLQALETVFFPSGSHFEAISKVTRAARHCAVVWTGDGGAFTASENAGLRSRRRDDPPPFPGPLKRADTTEFVEPPMTAGAARRVLDAHPDVGCAAHRPLRAALNALPADTTTEDLPVVWLRIAGLFEDLPLVDLQVVRWRLDALEGDEGRAAAYWFTDVVYRQAILCETPPSTDLTRLDNVASSGHLRGA